MGKYCARVRSLYRSIKRNHTRALSISVLLAYLAVRFIFSGVYCDLVHCTYLFNADSVGRDWFPIRADEAVIAVSIDTPANSSMTLELRESEDKKRTGPGSSVDNDQ
jgi:hypothetical protein